MPRRSGLGRGLGALIPAEVNASESALREIPLAQIRPNQFQPRKQFSEEALAALVDSIRAVGVLQPVLVRAVDEGEGEGGYELIAGERRCRAARRAGLQHIPALVQSVSDAVSLEQALIENIQREQLNALDEAAAYQQLIEDFGLTHEDVARRVGRSRAAITNALRLFQLPPLVQRLVREERLGAGHARALLSTPDREQQEQLAAAAAEEGWSVRTVEGRVRALGESDDESDESGPPFPGEPPDEWRAGSREEAILPDSRGEPATRPGAGTATSEAPDEGSGGVWRAEPGDGAREQVAAPPAATENGRSAPALRPPGVLELEQLLEGHLDTRVRVEMGGKHGRVVIDFATIEDLERIYRVMIAGRPT